MSSNRRSFTVENKFLKDKYDFLKKLKWEDFYFSNPLTAKQFPKDLPPNFFVSFEVKRSKDAKELISLEKEFYQIQNELNKIFLGNKKSIKEKNKQIAFLSFGSIFILLLSLLLTIYFNNLIFCFGVFIVIGIPFYTFYYYKNIALIEKNKQEAQIKFDKEKNYNLKIKELVMKSDNILKKISQLSGLSLNDIEEYLKEDFISTDNIFFKITAA